MLRPAAEHFFYLIYAQAVHRDDVQAAGKPGTLIGKAYGGIAENRHRKNAHKDPGNHLRETGEDRDHGIPEALDHHTADT